MPADVRKGCAFPVSGLKLFAAMPPGARRSLFELGEVFPKGTAFPHIRRQSRDYYWVYLSKKNITRQNTNVRNTRYFSDLTSRIQL